MVRLVVIYHCKRRINCTGFFVVCPVNQAADAGMNQRARAHSARFNCNKQLAINQSMVTDACSGFAQRHDFRVSGRIGVAEVAIPTAPNDFSSEHNHCADWYLSGVKRTLCGAQSFFHPELIGVWSCGVIGSHQ
jgi:hypothetical protein